MLVRLFDRLLGALRGSPSVERHTQWRNDSWSFGNPDARYPYDVGPYDHLNRLLNGMEFRAFLRTATPLRILRRHGEVVPLGSPLAEDCEPWMGAWVPKVKTFREVGLDIDELEPLVASSLGPVSDGDLLRILIAIREAAEDPAGGTEARVVRVRAVCSGPEVAAFAASQGGVEAVCDHLFPPILSLIHGLPRTSQAELRRLGLATVAALRGASDEALLAVNGIGPSKLSVIREFCAGFDGDLVAERRVDLAT